MTSLLCYLTAVAAKSVAALGALSQGAPVAAGPSLSGTLLKYKDTTSEISISLWSFLFSV